MLDYIRIRYSTARRAFVAGTAYKIRCMRRSVPLGRAASGRSLTSERLGVLAICDSPVVRQLVTTVFSKEGDFFITTAFDWRHAEHRLRTARPDVAVLCSDRLRPDDEGARAIHTRKIPLVAGTLDIRAANV